MKRLIALLLLTVLMVCTAAAAETLPLLKLHQIYLTCADAYVMLAGDTVALVDCGTNTDRQDTPGKLFDYLDAIGIDHIDVYFVSHYHNDHAYNIDELMERYGTDRTVIYGPSRELPEQFLPLPAGHYEQLVDGQQVSFGDFEVLCIGPDTPDRLGLQNRDSQNLLITYGERTFMFTGDYVLESMPERHGAELAKVDVLKFPHHGYQPFCISPETLRLMDPQIILLSSYYPGGVRGYLKQNGVTGEAYDLRSGHIVVTCDGVELEVHTQVTKGDFGVDYQRYPAGYTVSAVPAAAPEEVAEEAPEAQTGVTAVPEVTNTPAPVAVSVRVGALKPTDVPEEAGEVSASDGDGYIGGKPLGDPVVIPARKNRR